MYVIHVHMIQKSVGGEQIVRRLQLKIMALQGVWMENNPVLLVALKTERIYGRKIETFSFPVGPAALCYRLG